MSDIGAGADIGDEAKERWYRCRYGHHYMMRTPFTIFVRTGHECITSAPLCPYCLIFLLNDRAGAEEEQ